MQPFELVEDPILPEPEMPVPPPPVVEAVAGQFSLLDLLECR